MSTSESGIPRKRSSEKAKEMEKPLVDKSKDSTEQSHSVSTPKSIISPASGLVALLSGVAFGFAVDRAQLNVPYTIVKQLEFDNFTMMRMFLAASATSSIAITASHSLGFYERCPKAATKLGFNLFGGHGGNVLGGLLLGVGMATSGACPGTVFAQLGAYPGARTGLIVAGGLTAIIIFGYLENKIKAAHTSFLGKQADKKVGRNTLLNVLSLGSAAIMGAVIFGLDWVFPWQTDMNKIVTEDLSATSSFMIWDPLVAGIVVGSLQLTSIIASGGSFGMSSGWVVPSYYISSIFDSNVKENAPLLHSYKDQVAANWQLITAIGAIVGSYVSANVFPASSLSPDAMAYQQAGINDFIGGFLMLLGARLGGGCTSGHGLSGLAMVSTSSLISVACMFGGGMATRAIMSLL